MPALLLLLLFTENTATKLVLYCIFNVFVLYHPNRSQVMNGLEQV